MRRRTERDQTHLHHHHHHHPTLTVTPPGFSVDRPTRPDKQQWENKKGCWDAGQLRKWTQMDAWVDALKKKSF